MRVSKIPVDVLRLQGEETSIFILFCTSYNIILYHIFFLILLKSF